MRRQTVYLLVLAARVSVYAGGNPSVQVILLPGSQTECTDAVSDGSRITVHYTGTIDASSKAGEPGAQFDSSRGRGPFEFVVGAGQVIQALTCRA